MLTVAVRFRPETSQTEDASASQDENKNMNNGDIAPQTIQVFEEPQNYIRINDEFNLYFDHVLSDHAFQDQMFSTAIRPKANDFLNGNNCCILTYGAKKAGKSYTMFGKLENKNAVSHLGILPRTVSYIIEKLYAFYKDRSNVNMCVDTAMDWNLLISFGNVYNDEITDLINVENQKNIHLKKNKKTNEFYLKNLSQIKIKKISSFLKNLHLAYKNRKLFQHKSNVDINRCHFFAVVKLNIYTIIDTTKSKVSSTVLNFIDCASYPRINYKPFSETDRLDYESLNFSFIQLNALMTRIAKNNDLAIDMRESVLTQLLFPIRQNHRSLVNQYLGNESENVNQNIDDYGKLLIVINCTLNKYLRNETMATLRFGNLPTVDPFLLSMMEKQRHKIKKLEQKNKELKVRIKLQKKELRQSGNGQSNMDESEEINEYKKKIIALNRKLESLRVSNQELMRQNNEYFAYQNKFQSLQSENELLKLDYGSITKEFNTQKNHDFWLMEDFNDLKVKYDSLCNAEPDTHNKQTQSCNLNTTNDQITDLLSELSRLRDEKKNNNLLLKGADNKLSEYESEIEEYRNEIQKTLDQHRKELDERDQQISELRKELQSIKESETVINNECESKGHSKEYIIRQLKMEIIKYKTDINNSSIVSKLRNKKSKLEEKVINLRTEKAKELVKFNAERHKMQLEMEGLKTKIRNQNAIRKWTNLVQKRRIISVSQDMDRANRKMKEKYNKNSEFRDQMYLLRKIAEQKTDLALKHKMSKSTDLINKYDTPSPSLKSVNHNQNSQTMHIISASTMDFEQLAIATTADFEKEMVGLLPSNLKRIHELIDELTNKLMIKNGKLHKLRSEYETLNRKYLDLSANKPNLYNSDSYDTIVNTEHEIMNSSFDDYLPSILDKLNLNHSSSNDTFVAFEETQIGNVTDSINDDFENEENYLKKSYDSAITKTHINNRNLSKTSTAALKPLNDTEWNRANSESESQTETYRILSNKVSKPKQFTFRARAHTLSESTLNQIVLKNHGNTHLTENEILYSEIEQRQKQMRLLQESLSITFHIGNSKKNSRIKMNVCMSPKDVFDNLVSQSLINPNRNESKPFTLQIKASVDAAKIVIPFQNTNMSFWQLIVEFGILNLLHFQICLGEKQRQHSAAEKKSSDESSKRNSGIWNMFAKK